MPDPATPILELSGLTKRFRARRMGKTYTVTAVNAITLDVVKGEVLGIVGESGCGKTTVGRMIIGLEKADEGEIRFGGTDLVHRRGVRLDHPAQAYRFDESALATPGREAGIQAEEVIGHGLDAGLGKGIGPQDDDAMIGRCGVSREACQIHPADITI